MPRFPLFRRPLLCVAVLLLVFCSRAMPRTVSRQESSATPAIAAPTIPSGRSLVASVDGTPQGDGSEEHPWDLQTALANPAGLAPGDTVWVRGGVYRGAFHSYLNGTPERPIVIRARIGDRVTIDGGNSNGVAVLTVFGSYVWFWGLEVASSDPTRTTTDTGSWPSGVNLPRGEGVLIDQSQPHPGLKFINLVVHDLRQGLSFWKEAQDGEITGCLVYYNGWEAPDRDHGHGIYTQNQTGTKRFIDNVVFQNFSHGFHAYGSEDSYLDNLYFEGNASFENGDLGRDGPQRNFLVGGGRVAQNPQLINNFFYYPQALSPGSAFQLGYTAGCANAILDGNFISNDSKFVQCTPQTMAGNTFCGTVGGLALSAYPNNAQCPSRPEATNVFVRPNRFDPNRAMVVVFNFAGEASVAADLSSVLSVGDGYEIRNARDVYGPAVLSGVHDGTPVALPMTGLSNAAPVGWQTPAPNPEFNVFLVLRTSAVREPVQNTRPAQSPREQPPRP
jgi:hypothetical protein